MHTAFDVRAQQPFNPVQFQTGIERLLSQQKPLGSKSEPQTDAQDDQLEEQVLRKILLVEDNVINQKVALRILSQFGYTADTALNGAEALKALEKEQYDLILMDIQMPIMDGISATRSIRDRFGPEIPYIIAVTANVTSEDRKNCYEAGMNDFVSKPIRSELLAAAINKAPLPKASPDNKKNPVSEKV